MLSALLICGDAVCFRTLFIVFYIAMVYKLIDRDGTSSLLILRYALKTNRIGTSLLESSKLLIALKNIWSTKLGLIPGILILIIK